MNPITVVLVEDHSLVREGIARLLTSDGSIEVVGQAATIAEGAEIIERLLPDVVLLDVDLLDGNGLDLCDRVSAKTRVLVLSATGRQDQFSRAMSAGARGYLLKRADTAMFMAAVRAVADGDIVVDPALQANLFAAVRRDTTLPEPLDRCDRRQLELLLCLAAGSSTAEIASQLYISSGTCRNWVSRLLRLLDVRNRTEAALIGSAHRSVIENHLRTAGSFVS